jgi:hypothetical protein
MLALLLIDWRFGRQRVTTGHSMVRACHAARRIDLDQVDDPVSALEVRHGRLGDLLEVMGVEVPAEVQHAALELAAHVAQRRVAAARQAESGFGDDGRSIGPRV